MWFENLNNKYGGEDLFRSPTFPHWAGFIWTLRYTRQRPVSFEVLKTESRSLQADIHKFYDSKDEDVIKQAGQFKK